MPVANEERCLPNVPRRVHASQRWFPPDTVASSKKPRLSTPGASLSLQARPPKPPLPDRSSPYDLAARLRFEDCGLLTEGIYAVDEAPTAVADLLP
jgi:hypothetical protein